MDQVTRGKLTGHQKSISVQTKMVDHSQHSSVALIEDLRGQGHKITAPRHLVIEHLSVREDNFSAEELVESLAPIGRATIYRTLKLLVDGGLICKVDDLEFRETADGTYVVSALLSGSLALGPRLPGRLGRWVVAIARRMSTDPDPAPERIPFERVTELGSAIVLDRRREDVGVSPLEDWVREHIIEPIPGSSHEGE